MRTIFIFFSFFLSTLLFSQNVTISDLISLRKMNLAEAESFLSEKGWIFKGGNAPNEKSMGKANFYFGVNGDMNYAKSFITFFYSEKGNRVSIQTNKQAKYLELFNEMQKFKPVLSKNVVEDNKLIKVYQGKTTTFEFTTTSSGNRFGEKKAIWLLMITGNDDYDLVFK